MTHSLFLLPHASEQALTTMMVGGVGVGAALLVWVLYLLWRDKRRGVGRYKPRLQRTRARKVRKRA